jgi:hypothetical protein
VDASNTNGPSPRRKVSQAAARMAANVAARGTAYAFQRATTYLHPRETDDRRAEDIIRPGVRRYANWIWLLILAFALVRIFGEKFFTCDMGFFLPLIIMGAALVFLVQRQRRM